MFTLFTMTIESKFSKPKDRIYGLMGLSTMDWDPSRQGHPFVDPNYSITIMECYCRLSVKLLVEMKDLRVLSLAHNGQSIVDESWPSWVSPFTSPSTYVFADLRDNRTDLHETAGLVDISETTRGAHHCINVSGFKIGVVGQGYMPYLDTYGAVRRPEEGSLHIQHLLRTLQNSYSPEYLAYTFRKTDIV
ncbi:hypothetical protein A1F94_001100 [Pyrenophora tritici-repentis]|uniref:Uncharacterized protein n=1 Tax=Pyrenophora tritici-repentis TaxID=45151 RepID=A0A2W1ERD9_9PLEO|nr:hypothetical protein PtrV1_01726 [Pyrenophora tritici-repentis]KAG9388208.1 hypothetical protein A1F94_001100 [Pyrenophora tritici-repentis]KAI1513515.1 hypothetical protein Ptr86124_007417 [Pyrenophora tritici-repentis]